uniref:Peptidase M12B propeptide domain-containing protein n=1 Tax=Strix occidentalis caurina TaxID=311401 RepID=A0A8D0FFW3_STROC
MACCILALTVCPSDVHFCHCTSGLKSSTSFHALVVILVWFWVFLLAESRKSRPRPYGLVIPISTNADGSYISNILSASHQRRSTREVSQSPKQLYFNVTAFGREFHLRLKPNTRLVQLWKREPLWTNCAYVGDITDIPGASVAISNCDGLVSLPCSPRIATDLSFKEFIYKISMVFVFLHAVLFHQKVSYEN